MKTRTPYVVSYLIAAFLLVPGYCSVQAHPVIDKRDVGALQTEKVVMLMRHGARFRFAEDELARFSSQPMPDFGVPNGMLNAHARHALVLWGQYHAQRLVQQGVLPSNAALREGAVTAFASPARRTFDSANAFLEGLLPGNALAVSTTGTHRWFRPRDNGIRYTDYAEAAQAVMDAVGTNMEEARIAARPLLRATQRQLGLDIRHDFAALPWDIGRGPYGMYIVPLRMLSQMTEGARMAYVNNLPMPDQDLRGVSAQAALARLLAVNRLNHALTQRPRYMAVRHIASLLPTLSETLMLDSPETVALFMGHETNLSSLRAVLGFEWAAPEHAPNDIGPNAMLMFERVRRVGTGERFVRISYHSPTMDQLRYLQPLDAANPPITVVFEPQPPLAYPGTHLISVRSFTAWVEQVVQEAATRGNAGARTIAQSASPSGKPSVVPSTAPGAVANRQADAQVTVRAGLMPANASDRYYAPMDHHAGTQDEIDKATGRVGWIKESLANPFSF